MRGSRNTEEGTEPHWWKRNRGYSGMTDLEERTRSYLPGIKRVIHYLRGKIVILEGKGRGGFQEKNGEGRRNRTPPEEPWTKKNHSTGKIPQKLKLPKRGEYCLMNPSGNQTDPLRKRVEKKMSRRGEGKSGHFFKRT